MPVHSSAVDAARLVAAVRGLADRLERHRTELNRLNVYPVPDGDTGDNLLATITTVVEALPASTEHTEVVQAIARGALLGGRGSSGVILGQALRGFVQTLPDPCGPEGLAGALEAAADAAWQAIADPVEGTILTVAREAARQARAVATHGSLADVVGEAAAEARRSLARTPDLLPALARAEVVDAGGFGYVLFLDALAEAVAGLESAPIELAAAPALDAASGALDDVDEAGVVTTRYEVVCLLEADDAHVADLRGRWGELGDTVAIAGGGGTWRGHVHTDEVTAALAAARQAGEVSQVEVTDLAEQVGQEVGLRAALPGDGTVAIVAVAEGDGLVAAYLESGAHRVVTGGATSKPSTGELLRVIDACGGPVVLLTGDADVVPAAERALELGAAPGRLVAVDMLAGLIALDAVGPRLDGDAAAGADRLAEAARETRTVHVQRAVRPARTELGAVRAGDWLAMGDSGLITVAPTAGQALLAAAAAVVTPTARTGLLALDLDAEDGDATAQKLSEAHPQVAWRTIRANRRSFAYGLAVR